MNLALSPGDSCGTRSRRAAFGLAVVALAAACDPQVGRLHAWCGEDAASAATAYTATAYGGAAGASASAGAAAGCPDAGPDAAVNTVVPDAGVTGNVVIADQLNNRVLVLDRQGKVAFSFGDGSSVAGPTSIVAPNDAEYLPTSEVLTVGTGAPMGAEPSCAGTAGCVDDRVIIVDYATRAIVWQFGGHGGGAGSGALSAPASARLVATSTGDHVLVSDQGNGRVVEIDRTSSSVVWQYPPAGAPEADAIGAQSAERLANGDTLIADQAGNRAVEVTRAGAIVWQYPEIINVAALDFPAYASRLPNGDTLIADANNNRVLEIDQASPGDIVWSYEAKVGSFGSPEVTGAVRLANGHTLITLLAEGLVLEVDHASPPNVLYVHGSKWQPGRWGDALNEPYNAKVAGDYTGLSAP